MALKVGRHIGTCSDGDIWAEVNENGSVRFWIEFDNTNKKDKPGMVMPLEVWDRVVAWVEWQRKNKGFEKLES
jgi:hypothetical protein